MSSTDRDVVVVGGGMAGLTCAWRLHQAGLRVTLLEEQNGPGGNVSTTLEEGFRLERGPHTFLGSADGVFLLVEKTGLEEALVSPRPEAKARFIARNGRLHAVPTGPWSFLTTSLLSGKAKAHLLTEPWRVQRGGLEDTAADFFQRRFGTEGAEILAGAFISGVYAGDPSRLSAPAAFPLFWGFEQDRGSMIRGALRYRRARRKQLAEQGRTARRGLFSFAQGLGQLPERLAADLSGCCSFGVPAMSARAGAQGWRVTTPQGALQAPIVVVATPPHRAARVLEELDSDLARLLAGIPLAPVAVVHLGYDQRLAEIPDGFGFLVPRNQGIRTLGVLFPSRLFAGRAPEGGDLLAGFVGGTTDPKALQLSDEDLRDIVRRDLMVLTGLSTMPSFLRVRRYSHAIPQLVVGHLARLEQIDARLAEHQGLFLAGNYLRGVGLKDAVASGFDAADAVLHRLGGAREVSGPPPAGARDAAAPQWEHYH